MFYILGLIHDTLYLIHPPYSLQATACHAAAAPCPPASRCSATKSQWSQLPRLQLRAGHPPARAPPACAAACMLVWCAGSEDFFFTRPLDKSLSILLYV